MTVRRGSVQAMRLNETGAAFLYVISWRCAGDLLAIAKFLVRCNLSNVSVNVSGLIENANNIDGAHFRSTWNEVNGRGRVIGATETKAHLDVQPELTNNAEHKAQCVGEYTGHSPPNIFPLGNIPHGHFPRLDNFPPT